MARATAASAADDAERAAAQQAADEMMDALLGDGGGGSRSGAGGASLGHPLTKSPYPPLPNVLEPELVAGATSRTAAAREYWKNTRKQSPPSAVVATREALLRSVRGGVNAAAGLSLGESTRRLRLEALAGL
jgi:hypothetical protein